MDIEEIKAQRERFHELHGYYPKRAGMHYNHLDESSPREVDGMEVIYAHMWGYSLEPFTLYFLDNRNEVIQFSAD